MLCHDWKTMKNMVQYMWINRTVTASQSDASGVNIHEQVVSECSNIHKLRGRCVVKFGISRTFEKNQWFGGF